MADTLQHEDQDAKKMADPAAILRQAALDLMASYVAVGVPDSQAAIRACNETGYRNSLELGRQWKDWEPLYAARVLFAKRLLVSILQSRGWSNQAIADVLDVHAKHIPRMKRRLRADVARRKALLQGQEEARQGGS
jgi:hypothetical protein